MIHRRPVILMLVLSAVLGWRAAPAQAQDGIIEGRLGLTLADGRQAHGDWIRVMLVKEAVDIATVKAGAVQLAHDEDVAVVRMHLELHKAVMARLNADPDYVVASALTTEDGTFKFVAIPPGRFYVLVCFPAVIRERKVAWQVPVDVEPAGTVTVGLDENNLALPTGVEQ